MGIIFGSGIEIGDWGLEIRILDCPWGFGIRVLDWGLRMMSVCWGLSWGWGCTIPLGIVLQELG